MIRRMIAFVLAVALSAGPVAANWCALPARNGSATLSGVVNTYYPGTASVSTGGTSIRIGTARGANQSIAAGDLILVIQMQDATIGTSNNANYGDGDNGGYGNGYTGVRQSGVYEYVRANNSVGTGGGTLTIQGATGGGLRNSYNHAAATSSAGRRSFQIVKVPQYDQVTITGTVIAAAWNGSTGGIVALDVARRLTFSGGVISVAGQGFRGGAGRALGSVSGSNTSYRHAASTGLGGSKGEGIAGTPRYVLDDGDIEDAGTEGYANGSLGRGAPGNAGGGATDGDTDYNSENPGGGGGGNAGAGGLGGHAWCGSAPVGCPQTGGHPGASVDEIGVGRVVMGGGGGAGSSNNGTGSPASGLASSGAAGGGIVMIRAGEIAGTGTINANGATGNSTVQNDGTGGGGGGGSVLVSTVRQITGTALSIQARGGNGGSNTGGGSAHGPGGGGGGGLVATSFTSGANVSGGSAGTTANGGSYGASYGALAGSGGNGIVIDGADIPGLSSGGECTPTVIKTFPTSPTSPGVPTPLRITVTNNNPTQQLTGLALTDTYPAGLVNAPAPSATKSCSTAATLSASAGGGDFRVSGGVIAARTSCTYSVNTMVSDHTSRTNSIGAGEVRGSYNVAVTTLEGTSATLGVAPPLTIVKSSQAYADPVLGMTNPKNIPGAFVAYTLTVVNPAPYTVTADSISIIDPTPANLSLYVANVPGGSGPLLFIQGNPSSALTYTFSGLGSTTDDVDFSNNNGASWTYTPINGGNGVDPAVTHIRIRPKGAMTAGSSFSIMLGYRVE